MSRNNKLIAGLFIMGLLLLIPELSEAKNPLGKKWTQSQQVSMDVVNHEDFDALLDKYVDQNGYVKYRSLKSNRSDKLSLRNYLAHLSKANPRLKSSKNAKLAFWINAYNAVTLEGILQVYPTSSIRNHTAKVFGYNIWKQLPLIVGNKQYNLEQIEHEILRKMNEPRIHFAIVCASIGCPRLLNEAYTAENVDQQLTKNAKDFFSRRSNFRIDSRTKTVHTSSILEWFGTDFGQNDSAVLKAIYPYLTSDAKAALKNPGYRLSYLNYNWDLNDQASLRK
jgi:Protein of unknown function, DUF547